MRNVTSKTRFLRSLGVLGVASLALVLPQAPTQAGGDITNFKVRNCTQERIFVCSFDKTDSLMNIPYKARGIKPGEKKEFGCASIGRCKVIIGVSRKKSAKTLSAGVEAAMSTGAVTAAALAGMTGAVAMTTTAGTTGMVFVANGVAVGGATAIATASTISAMTVAAGAAAVVAVGAGASVAALEIADGWSDGEVCNQVKKAARKANLKPKHFMQNNRNYKVIEQYALDKDGNAYVNADGTAVFAYITKKGKSACPAPLAKQLISN